VACVLAHEMSHVALRHGAAQQGRAGTWQTILDVAGAAAGAAGGGLLQQGVNLGGGLGVGSLLGKYSRDAERDADLNGARMAADAGYNPIEMARFFEKLNAQVGEAGRPKGLEKWLADHPDTLNRVKYVEEDVQTYPVKQYTADSGQFAAIKRLVARMPPPKPKPGALTTPVEAQARPNLPQGFVDMQTKDFAVAYPKEWKVGKAEQTGPLYIIPEGGIAKGQNGGVELIAGAMFDYFNPKEGAADLKAGTQALLQGLQQGDKNMKAEASQPVQLGGKPALMTKISTQTSFPADPNQTAFLFTVARPSGLWMMVLAAPNATLQRAEPAFKQMIQTVKFEE
jgi:beta-barrel assembly-enhancing protease